MPKQQPEYAIHPEHGTPILKYSLEELERGDLNHVLEWREAIYPVFNAEPLASADSVSVNKITSFKVGSMVFGQVEGGPHRFVRDAEVMTRGGNEQLLIQLYIKGGYRGQTSAGPIHVRENDISILDLDGTFETETDAFVTLNIVIARDLLSSRLPATESLHALVLRREAVATRILAHHFLTLKDVIPDANEEEANDLVESTLALMAASIKPALYQRLGIANSRLDEEMSATLRRYIMTNLADPKLSVTDLAKRFAVSRATLYRIFASYGGIAQFVRRERLRCAFRDLRQNNGAQGRVSVVAKRWGFGSDAAFTRAFKLVYGVSPSIVRIATDAKRITKTQRAALAQWLTDDRHQIPSDSD
jgi:AraC-like DNA-binding protein